MPARTILAVASVLVFGAPSATAEDCQSLDQSGRAARIRQAPSCDTAMSMFGECAYGAGGDTALGQIVTQRCERDFLPRLGASRQRAYRAGIARCNSK